jgi:hypothetical protein
MCICSVYVCARVYPNLQIYRLCRRHGRQNNICTYIYDMELSADTAATNPKERGPRDFSRGIKKYYVNL